MAQHTVKVGNTIILSVGANDPFSDGHTTGYLEFYDERHRPTFPLTSHTIHDYLMTIRTSHPCLLSGKRDVS